MYSYYRYIKMTSMFKMKPDKPRYFNEVTTLDETHRKIVDEFNKKKNTLPELKTKLKKLEQKLEQLEAADKSTYTTGDIKTRSELKSKISLMKDSIYDVE